MEHAHAECAVSGLGRTPLGDKGRAGRPPGRAFGSAPSAPRSAPLPSPPPGCCRYRVILPSLSGTGVSPPGPSGPDSGRTYGKPPDRGGRGHERGRGREWGGASAGG